VRTALDNPFRPGADTVPDVWAGRSEQLHDWDAVLRVRLESGLPERGRTVLGEAGLGKSALVRRIAESAEREGAWVTPQIRIPVGADAIKAVAGAVLKLADQAGLPTTREKRIRELLDRVRTVAVKGISLTLDRRDGPAPYQSLTELLVEIGRVAIKRKTLILIHVDEVQNITDETELSHLLVSLGDAITYEETVTAPGGAQFRRTLPIAVYLTGLPDFVDLAGAKRGATFARRFATTTLGPISAADLKLALQPFVVAGWEVADGQGGVARIRMTQDAAELLADLSCGEPFLFQLGGERAWLSGESATITSDDVKRGWETIQQEAALHVERILDRLPHRERQFLEAMAALDPADRTLTNIARGMGYAEGSQAGPTAQRLDTIRGVIDRGKPYTFRHRAVAAYLTTSWPRV